MTRAMVIAAALLSAGAAWAQGDPMEAAADAQVAPQAPGSVRVGTFFHGAGKKTDWQVMLESGKCYWFSGIGGPGVKKLAIYLWGPDGKRVTEAKSPTPTSTLAHCNYVPGMFHFQGKIEGDGPYVIGIYSKAAPQQVSAPPPPTAPPPPQVPDFSAQCDSMAGNQGARRVGNFYQGSLGHHDKQDYSIQMDAGKCYFVIGCGEPGKVKALSLYLWGPDNKRITEMKPDSPNAMIGHCANYPGMYKVQVKVSSGEGAFRMGLYTK